MIGDLEKQKREKSANSLESFIFKTQEKLYQEEHRFVSAGEQREDVSRKLSEASSWMEESSAAATKLDVNCHRFPMDTLYFAMEGQNRGKNPSWSAMHDIS
ncbi:hypoxia up-regulated protein 1-like [Strigops habroptila]|uniref:hypoxia up-regulated protein 1-like n=1 Tax=Strigops habroptila TaxID=2489341 RepID=UPI0011D0068D|nr:hypoxia up-regulated protein 1-like [Strigops habroptila]